MEYEYTNRYLKNKTENKYKIEKIYNKWRMKKTKIKYEQYKKKTEKFPFENGSERFWGVSNLLFKNGSERFWAVAKVRTVQNGSWTICVFDLGCKERFRTVLCISAICPRTVQNGFRDLPYTYWFSLVQTSFIIISYLKKEGKSKSWNWKDTKLKCKLQTTTSTYLIHAYENNTFRAISTDI